MLDVAERAMVSVTARATTLSERLERATTNQSDEDDPALVERRIEQWCQVVAKGDWDVFSKRLAWDGLDLNSARQAMQPVHPVDEIPLPAWAEILQEALGLVAADETDEGEAS